MLSSKIRTGEAIVSEELIRTSSRIKFFLANNAAMNSDSIASKLWKKMRPVLT